MSDKVNMSDLSKTEQQECRERDSKEPEFLLMYDVKEDRYILFKNNSNLRVFLDNDMTPMDEGFYSQILKPAIARIRQEVETMQCEHENIEPSTVDGEVRCTECGATVRR